MSDLYTINGDVREVDWGKYPTPQTIITSPPYWAKRRYPIPDLWWPVEGEDIDRCPAHGAHRQSTLAMPPIARKDNDRVDQYDATRKNDRTLNDVLPSAFCECGAWFGQLGQEPTPDLYVEHLAGILDGLPLAPDGVLWLNIDDTWAGNGSGLKAKNLALVPERVALAMQARGWYVRGRIVWSKTNALPSSVRDRPQHAYETVWLMSRSARYKYYKDACLVDTAPDSAARRRRGVSTEHKYGQDDSGQSEQTINRPRANEKYQAGTEYMSDKGLHSRKLRDKEKYAPPEKRTLRDVWSMATAASRTEHIAPMPKSLVERCILLATDPCDWVLDPFAGTGTVVTAANALGRRAIGVEVDERFSDWLDEPQQHALGV